MTPDRLPLPELRRTPADRPQLLVGDGERTEVCSLLNEHFTAGRLTLEELQERLDSCVRARTVQELQALCDDLPRLSPSPSPATPPAHRAVSTLRGASQALVGIGVLLAVPLVLLMLAGSTILGPGISFFSLVGGTLATFVGAGTTYLLLSRSKRSPS